MQRKNKFLILITAIVILIILISLNNLPLSRETIQSRFVVGENMGFDLTPGRLNFGKIVPGNSNTRGLLIENEFDRPVEIIIKSSGEISDNIIVSENNFILNPQESKNVTFSAYAEQSLEFGEYNGQIEIISKKA